RLKLSLNQLEVRLEQAESVNTSVVKNRHKDTVRWKALALEYEMKIRYLERALAQEESKLRIAEQASLTKKQNHAVHREEGLELHLEMATRQREEARATTKTAAIQEEMLALTSQMVRTNTLLTIAENSRLKLEQELAFEK
ncbi:unnamed protein product, partial [Laminaria digitata]